jgi:hypothetical protein
MVKYVENKFDEDYIQTLGVNFMEKSINLRHTEITFSIWDLGGASESPFISDSLTQCPEMLPPCACENLISRAAGVHQHAAPRV